MKICVSASANNLDAPVDPRFARCRYFIIVDSESMEFEAVPNIAAEAVGGAGFRLHICKEYNAEVIGRIPFDLKVTEAMVNGKTIIEYSPESGVAEEIKKMWERILSMLKSFMLKA